MTPDFSKFDLSGRDPRPIQADTLKKLAASWNDADVHALLLPTGTGKTAIGRAIQIATGADVIVPSNILMDQAVTDYPKTNFLQGKTRYQCHSNLTCHDWQGMDMEPCDECPYEKCKKRAATEPTFFNPLSMYYFLANARGVKRPKVLVVDEAHQLASMVLMLTSKRLKRSDYRFTQACCNELYLSRWLKEQLDRLDRLSALYHKKQDFEKLAKCKSEIESLSLIKQGIDEDGQNYVVWITKDEKDAYLNIKPLFPPRFLMQKFFAGKKVILMSGTLFDHDIKALVGDVAYNKIEQNSPIPKKNRRILYKPAPFKINYQTDPKQLVAYIEQYITPDAGNTLIHSTYSLSRKLAPLFSRPIIFNTQDDKDEQLQKFLTSGGTFLASGCAEGLDLKYDLCRTNVIPKIPFPDLGDPAVVKRKSLQDGAVWYALESLKTVIQASGRSTRAIDDYSTVYILDPNFGHLIQRYGKYLPKYFTEAIER